MNKHLSVYLHNTLAGQLTQDKHGQISFSYCQDWLESADSVPLSHSLPLSERPFAGKNCQGFFAGVLPEEENRKIISAILGVSPRNDFAILEQIGGECAGAVTFLPEGKPLPINPPSYQRLSDQDLAEILRELPQRPLMAGRKDIRLSLAGAQNKLAIHLDKNGISLPVQNSPSTHILKPAIPRFDGVVQNELFCMELACKAGLPTAKVSIGSSDGIEYLLAERYDRRHTQEGILQRLHQEDFCQAHGLPPHVKYQNEGGPSLRQCFALIRTVSSTPAPDLLNLLDAVVFNFLIGNNDAHGKNFSFLYSARNGTQTTGLAPLYDLISTNIYPDLSPKMAMKIGSKYLARQVALPHWLSLWNDIGFPENAARKRTLRFTDKISAILSISSLQSQIQQDIADATQLRANQLSAMLG